MSIRALGLTVVSLALAAVPAFASAQVYTSACGTQPYPFSYTTTSTCGPQTLLVYVQVINPVNDSAAYAPNAFTVSVAGTNPSPSTFPGSLSGTPVWLGTGGYSVTMAGMPSDFTPSYSAGCSGTIYATGQGPTCVVTLSSASAYYPSPTPYPYPYTGPAQLTCAPAYQTINAGASATFTALNGTQLGSYSNAYNWQGPNRNFLGIGPSLTTVFQSLGVQTVIVSNGTQTASCTVNVIGSAGPVVYANTAPLVTTFIPALTPTLPNTGFAPVSATSIMLALVLLAVAAIATYPYVRKTALTLLD